MLRADLDAYRGTMEEFFPYLSIFPGLSLSSFYELEPSCTECQPLEPLEVLTATAVACMLDGTCPDLVLRQVEVVRFRRKQGECCELWHSRAL